MFKIQTLNNIPRNGLDRLPATLYSTANEIAEPDAVLVRSADMHKALIAASVKAVARAGAGVNNIPVATLSARGVPVFNAPGANANAVKELGVVGLGAIGVKVANAAYALGMRVVGFDPYMTVDGAWQLSSEVAKARSLNELFAASD